jgi:hypothetical protein
MVSESQILSEGSDASAAKDALLLSFRAFDLAIAAAVQTGLPLGEWFRCALVHIAGKAPIAGDEIAAVRSPSGASRGEPALHPNQNTDSCSEPSQDAVKEADSALEAAQKRIDELCNALQGLINLSDGKRVTDFAEVKRSLARAKEVLLASRQASPRRESSTPGEQNQGSEAA